MAADPGTRASAAVVSCASVDQMVMAQQRHAPQHCGGLPAKDGAAPQRDGRGPDEERVPVPRRQSFPFVRTYVDALSDAPELPGLRLPREAPGVLAEPCEIPAEDQWWQFHVPMLDRDAAPDNHR